MNWNKQGVTHFEMIAGLIIFILAVFGSLALYNSYFKNSNGLERANLDVFEKNFIKHSDNFTKVEIFVGTISRDCFNVSLNSNVNGSFEELYVLSNNTRTNFLLDVNGDISIENKNSNVYELYLFSFDREDKRLTSSPCENVFVDYSIPFTGKIFFSDTLEDFKMNYTNDYDNLKKRWDFPNDFSMTIKDVEDEKNILFNMTRTKPINTEILSKSFIIKIFDESENKIINAIVTVQIW
ncbi:MAG: hypothetical protein NTX24_05295 [Candidatus Pacearchaeota archaeon]|nr:hypothetical protein [Candidatus Pacearchaeota archaeon]